MDPKLLVEAQERLQTLEGHKSNALWVLLRQELEVKVSRALEELLNAGESQDVPLVSSLSVKVKVLREVLNMPAALASEIRLKLKQSGGPK